MIDTSPAATASPNAPEAQAQRQAASTALAKGDTAGANVAYAAELAALSGVTADTGRQPGNDLVVIAQPTTPMPADGIDSAFTAMATWDDPGTDNRATALRTRWGSDAGSNLQYAAAFGTAHPDVRQVLIAAGFANHPAIVEASAMLGRKYAHASGTAPTRTTTRRDAPPMTPAHDAQLETDLDTIRAQIAEAQAKGNSTRASRLYSTELEMIAQRRGSQTIVNGRRTA